MYKKNQRRGKNTHYYNYRSVLRFDYTFKRETQEIRMPVFWVLSWLDFCPSFLIFELDIFQFDSSGVCNRESKMKYVGVEMTITGENLDCFRRRFSLSSPGFHGFLKNIIYYLTPPVKHNSFAITSCIS